MTTIPIKRVFVTGGSGFVGKQLILYLVEQGIAVNALARSNEASQSVSQAGATKVVMGDICDLNTLVNGMDDCDIVIHSAAHVGASGGSPWEVYERVNVRGTQTLLRAATAAPSVRRFVHISTEATLCDLNPLINVDETKPKPTSPIGYYPKSKAQAEEYVLSYNGMVKAKDTQQILETVVIRPRFIWGAGDTNVLPTLLNAVSKGQFKFFGGGLHKTSVTHVKNVCHGALLAAQKGRGGEIYFITDGEHVVFKDFITEMLATQGVDVSNAGSIPMWLSWGIAWTCERLWLCLPLSGSPPLNRFLVWGAGVECTLIDDKARSELGYRNLVSREEGMKELREAHNS